MVRTPGGTIILDPSGRAAGRGAYLCRNADCWSAAGKRRAIEHALGASLPADLAATLEAGPDGPGSGGSDQLNNHPHGTPVSPAPVPMADTAAHEGGAHGQE